VKLGQNPGQPEPAKNSFARATDQLNEALSEVRRISHNLRPALLDDLGVVAAFKHLAGEFESASELPVSFHAEGEFHALSEISNTVLFRVAQEALTNIHKHAERVSHVHMQLICEGNNICLIISDDGTGFDIPGVANHPRRGIGLSNMQERLAAIGGSLELQSNAAGTTVTARIPNGDQT
jgi:two-component system NarL family sensor kinase